MFDNMFNPYSFPALIPCGFAIWERSGSVVECLTRFRGAAGASLTGVIALWH